jgi:hypothetical protein
VNGRRREADATALILRAELTGADLDRGCSRNIGEDGVRKSSLSARILACALLEAPGAPAVAQGGNRRSAFEKILALVTARVRENLGQ